MSPRRALEVQHLKYPSFLLELHFQKDISIEKGIRSKVKCRSSAHFPPIWESMAVMLDHRSTAYSTTQQLEIQLSMI